MYPLSSVSVVITPHMRALTISLGAALRACSHAHVNAADELESLRVHGGQDLAREHPRRVDFSAVRREPGVAPQFDLKALGFLFFLVLDSPGPGLYGTNKRLLGLLVGRVNQPDLVVLVEAVQPLSAHKMPPPTR